MSNKNEYVSCKWFCWTIGGLATIFGSIFWYGIHRMDKIEDNHKTIESMRQIDHDKIIRLETIESIKKV